MGEDIEKVSWNLAQGLILELTSLLQMMHRYYIRGELHKAYRCASVAKLTFIHSLDKDERDDLILKETKIEKGIQVFDELKNPNGFIESEKEKLLIVEKTWAELKCYIEKIMDLLEKYGYLIDKRKDASKMAL